MPGGGDLDHDGDGGGDHDDDGGVDDGGDSGFDDDGDGGGDDNTGGDYHDHDDQGRSCLIGNHHVECWEKIPNNTVIVLEAPLKNMI